MFFWPTFLLYGAGSLDEETMKKPLNVFPSIKPKLRTTKENVLSTPIYSEQIFI